MLPGEPARLTLVPADAWDHWLHTLADQVVSSQDKARVRVLVAGSASVTLDSRGRLTVPASHRGYLDGPELLVLGVVDKVEISSVPT